MRCRCEPAGAAGPRAGRRRQRVVAGRADTHLDAPHQRSLCEASGRARLAAAWCVGVHDRAGAGADRVAVRDSACAVAPGRRRPARRAVRSLCGADDRARAAGRGSPARTVTTRACRERRSIICGHSSGAGKSCLSPSLCRLAARRGPRSAPFSQNSTTRGRRAARRRPGEIGSASISGHGGARGPPTADPVLLNPTDHRQSVWSRLGPIRRCGLGCANARSAALTARLPLRPPAQAHECGHRCFRLPPNHLPSTTTSISGWRAGPRATVRQRAA